jgi:hypothetical protein
MRRDIEPSDDSGGEGACVKGDDDDADDDDDDDDDEVDNSDAFDETFDEVLDDDDNEGDLAATVARDVGCVSRIELDESCVSS